MAGTLKIAAILVADIVCYSRSRRRGRGPHLGAASGLPSDLIDPAIDSDRGCIVKRTADDGLIEFCVVKLSTIRSGC